jgi:hypothetical protein
MYKNKEELINVAYKTSKLNIKAYCNMQKKFSKATEKVLSNNLIMDFTTNPLAKPALRTFMYVYNNINDALIDSAKHATDLLFYFLGKIM